MLGKRTFHGIMKYSILIFTASGILIFNSCGDNSATGPDDDEIEVSKVVIEPQNVSFEVGEQREFSAFLISATGDTVNSEFEIDWNWYSSDPDVFTVEDGGTATGHNPGEAFCIVEAELENTKVAAKLRFVGRDSAFVTLLN